MSIVGVFPSTIKNGDTEDATVVMSLFSFIQSQVNGNACPATTGSIVLKGDGSGGTTGAAPGTDFLKPEAGMVFDYAGATVPSGYLLCDGSAVSRVTYSVLFTAIGTTWGAGDGSTTFNLPPAAGRASIGAGAGAGLTARTLGQKLGEEAHVLTTAELAAHNHAVTVSGATTGMTLGDPGHAHDTVLNQGASSTGSGAYSLRDGNPPSSAGPWGSQTSATGLTLGDPGHAHAASSANTGSGTAHNNMQPSIVFNKIIKI